VKNTSMQRGSTLLEAMLAMAVLAIGGAGVATLHSQGILVEADSRRLTRAAAIAQDLMSQVQLWEFTDARLALRTTTAATVADFAKAFETTADPIASNIADHGEADLTAGGVDFHGLPTASIADYQRYWNVATSASDDSNANGVPDGRRIAVVVRWPHRGTWRRLVLVAYKADPAEAR
jgi:Tfp pilus assembly protein PilV